MEPVSDAQLATLAGEARERWSVPGLAVGVLREGDVTLAADGLVSLGEDERVTPESVFRIASITKPFVATLAMTLVQDGLLELDEPLPGSPVAVTLRQLLSHQGGLTTEWPEPLDGFGESDDALERLARRDPERLPVGPGELFAYSNAGYWLVGAAIASAAGTTFEAAMAEGVLAPLGLSATGFDPEHGVPGHDQVTPGADDHHAADETYPRARRPSGGLWSNVEDLLRFAAHNLGGPGPLTPGSIAELQRPCVDGPGFQYGLGWFVTRRGGLAAVEHMGSVSGYQSLLLLVPEKQVAVAALANSSRGLAPIRQVTRRLGLAADRAEDHPLSAAALETFAGRYRGLGLELELTADEGMLRLAVVEVNAITGEELTLPPIRARPVGDAEFELLDGEWRGERFDFPRENIVRFGTLAARVE
jgi:CubicO group peptidase (beta-lactamase class C family)